MPVFPKRMPTRSLLRPTAQVYVSQLPRKCIIAGSSVGGFLVLIALATGFWYLSRPKDESSIPNSRLSSRYELPDNQILRNRFKRSIYEIGPKDEPQPQPQSHSPANSGADGANAGGDPNPPEYFSPFREYMSTVGASDGQLLDQPTDQPPRVPSGIQEFVFNDGSDAAELAHRISQTFSNVESLGDTSPRARDSHLSHSSISGKNSWDTLVNVAPGTAL
jgi:hypothetical protein